MTKTRNRKRPAVSLQERLLRFADEARAAAEELPEGADREYLERKAIKGETAANIERWLSSPGLRSPK